MRIGQLKPNLNKWQFVIEFGKCPPQMRGFYPYFKLMFIKLLRIPNEGEAISKENSDFKGIFIDWRFMRNIICEMKTFRIGKRYYQIPIKFFLTK